MDIGSFILGIAVLLAAAGLAWPLAERLRLPTTVLLAAVGVLLGYVVQIAGGIDMVAGLPLAGDLLAGLGGFKLSGNAFIAGFLPLLLFSAALTIDVRRLIENLGPVVLLAVVAVVVCTFLVGGAVAMVMGGGVVVALVLGAIVANTDSSAVVAIFRDTGAPARLTRIVEGESLFNDAAAISIFAVLTALIMDPAAANTSEAILRFVMGLFGGIAVGYLIARLYCIFIGIMNNATVAEITLTVSMAYLSFVVAEYYVDASGATAVVAAAMVMGTAGRTRVSPGTWATLLRIWEHIEFWATSFIFILAAMYVAEAFQDFGIDDMLVLAVVTVAAFAARALILWGLVPALSSTGLAAPMTSGQKLVLLWGGLRGAITVALALAIAEMDGFEESEKRLILVASTAFALFTLFVQGPTLRPLMSMLGLNALTERDRRLRDRVKELAEQRAGVKTAEVGGRLGLTGRTDLPLKEELPPFDEVDASEFGLLMAASHERDLALEYYEGGLTGRRVAELMRAQAGRFAEAARSGGYDGYRQAARDALKIGSDLSITIWLQQRTGLQGPLANVLANRLEFLLASEHALDDLILFAQEHASDLIGPQAASEVEVLLAERLDGVRSEIAAYETQFPEYVGDLRSHHLVRIAARFEDREYARHVHQSLITQEVYDDLVADHRARLRERKAPKLALGLKLVQMLGRVPLFEGLEEADLRRLGRCLTPMLAVPGQEIVRNGSRGRDMFFIVNGTVSVELPETTLTLGPGDFFGEMALVAHAPRSATVCAMECTSLLRLGRGDFNRVAQRLPGLLRKIEQVAAARASENVARSATGSEPKT